MPRLRTILWVLAPLLLLPEPAAATWSIVAVDSKTREVGIAGASCIQGVDVIAGLVPGRGVVAAQALSNISGRDRAVEALKEGAHPDAILDEIASDTFDPRPWHRLGGHPMRQYAIASLEGPSQASFTGDRAYDWAGAEEAPGVAVIGNILVNPSVVEDALAAFGHQPAGCTPDLADRLMAALAAGANAGGDRRCVPELSALSAFLAVAKPDDAPDAPSLRIDVPYEGINEMWFLLIRGFWPKKGTPEQNPVRILARRYREQRPQTCLSNLMEPR